VCQRQLLAPSAAATLGLLLTGCFGGQTGGEVVGAGGAQVVRDHEVSAPLMCVDQVEALAFDEPSGLSFTGADVLAFAGGTHTASLLWSPNSAPATYGPEQGESSIEMTVLYTGGQVRFVHSESTTPPNAGQATDLLAPGCQPDRLEVDVVVRLSTSGDALAEEFAATLRANSPTVAQLLHELPLDTLSGTFAVSVPPGYSTRSLKVDASLQADSFHGLLWGQVDVPPPSREDPKSGPLDIRYAQWPAPNSLDAP
jgi:hypothetical protein